MWRTIRAAPCNARILALYEAYAGNFQKAVREAAGSVEAKSEIGKPTGRAALGYLGDGKTAEAMAVYEKMRPLSARGASSSATG